MTKDWMSRKAELEKLYMKEGKTLLEIHDTFREHGFYASIRSYRLKFEQWGWKKKTWKKSPLRSKPASKVTTTQLRTNSVGVTREGEESSSFKLDTNDFIRIGNLEIPTRSMSPLELLNFVPKGSDLQLYVLLVRWQTNSTYMESLFSLLTVANIVTAFRPSSPVHIGNNFVAATCFHVIPRYVHPKDQYKVSTAIISATLNKHPSSIPSLSPATYMWLSVREKHSCREALQNLQQDPLFFRSSPIMLKAAGAAICKWFLIHIEENWNATSRGFCSKCCFTTSRSKRLEYFNIIRWASEIHSFELQPDLKSHKSTIQATEKFTESAIKVDASSQGNRPYLDSMNCFRNLSEAICKSSEDILRTWYEKADEPRRGILKMILDDKTHDIVPGLPSPYEGNLSLEPLQSPANKTTNFGFTLSTTFINQPESSEPLRFQNTQPDRGDAFRGQQNHSHTLESERESSFQALYTEWASIGSTSYSELRSFLGNLGARGLKPLLTWAISNIPTDEQYDLIHDILCEALQNFDLALKLKLRDKISELPLWSNIKALIFGENSAMLTWQTPLNDFTNVIDAAIISAALGIAGGICLRELKDLQHLEGSATLKILRYQTYFSILADLDAWGLEIDQEYQSFILAFEI